MSLDMIVLITLLALFILMMAVESVARSGRAMPRIRYWRLIGFAGLFVTFACNALMPLVIVPLLPAWHIVDISPIGLWGALPTVALTTFFTYWSHRIQHRFDLLWRLGHQLHHGVARIDIASSMIFHPIDLLVQISMTLLAATLLGIGAETAGLAGVLAFFIALYQHWDITTPHWTGLIIQRPEAHMLHHQRDVHARNFGDMPVWDMIFGTYHNPRTADVEVGFAPEASRRWLAMIACIDVNQRLGREKI